MSWLSKVLKKAKKPLLGALRTGLAAATGGTSEAVIRTAGAIKTAAKVAGINKKLKALPAVKLAETKYTVPAPTQGVGVQATTMPGGAPLGKRAAPGKPRKARKPKSAKRAASGKKRGPPKGGKDFKALSASWKAAGKPGTWLSWVKSH